MSRRLTSGYERTICNSRLPAEHWLPVGTRFSSRTTLAQGGATNMLDVRQAEQLVAVAAGSIADLERLSAQEENLISILLGDNPGPVVRGLKLTDQPHPPDVPAGIPSRLLERRPDIRAVEAQLMAANARIGVAKAAYFPEITLTGGSGLQSAALSSLFTGPAGVWNLGGSLAAADFRRRQDQVRGALERSPAEGDAADVRAHDQAGVPRCLGCPWSDFRRTMKSASVKRSWWRQRETRHGFPTSAIAVGLPVTWKC